MIQNRSEIAIRIAEMEDLKTVHFYQIPGDNDLLTGILAYYKDQTINLSSADDHYEELFDKITSLYARESATHRIVADEKSMSILQQSRTIDATDYSGPLSSFEEKTDPVFLPKAFAHCYILPIVKYILQLLYRNKSDTLEFDSIERDWFGQGFLYGVKSGKSLHFPYLIREKEAGLYTVSINNVLQSGNSLTLDLLFHRDGISVSFREKDYLYNGSLDLELTESGAHFSYCIKDNKDTILTFDNDYPAEPCGQMDGACELAQRFIYSGTENPEALWWMCYPIPWGGMVYQSVNGRDILRIYRTEAGKNTIDRGFVFRNLSEDDTKFYFGQLAFMLYSRNHLAELHLLDPGYPRSSSYMRNFAGKIYTQKSEEARNE